MTRALRIYLNLTKVGIPVLVTLSCVTGFLLAGGDFRRGGLAATAGIYLLASGAAALNQYQDREIDRLMERTKRRPIPSGALRSRDALWIALALIAAGLGILFFGTNALSFFLGLLALAWYNLFYTYGKRKSAFIFFPGGLIGAIPPMVGYSAAGGRIDDPHILALSAFLFIWQVPHFLLILLRHKRDYERAGLPLITNRFSTQKMRRIVSVWIVLTALAPLLPSLFGLVRSPLANFLLFAAALYLVWDATRRAGKEGDTSFLKTTFIKVNAFALLVLLVLSLDKLFSR
jgi:protoheme IX farnesyltransferase